MKNAYPYDESIVPTSFLGVEYCATFQAALYIETHSLTHQSEFHAASVALSRAADKRKSLINIHKNGYTATLTGGRVSHVHSNCSTARVGAVQSFSKFLQDMFTTLHVNPSATLIREAR